MGRRKWFRTPKEVEAQVIAMYLEPRVSGGWNGCKEIEKVLGVTAATVVHILRRNNVSIRSASESHAGKSCKPITHVPPKGEQPPLCKCGCGNRVSWYAAKDRWRAYYAGHYFGTYQPYKQREWLNREYTEKQRTAQSIATECGIHVTNVYRNLRKNGIPVRAQKISLRISGNVKGAKNPAWKGGIAKWEYAFNWKSLCKDIKDRDHWVCQYCGERRKRWGIHLHVHHVDEDKFNNDPSNLVSLCDKCHGLFHSKERPEFTFAVQR